MNNHKYLFTGFNLILITLLCYISVNLFYRVVFTQFSPDIKVSEAISINREKPYFSNTSRRRTRIPLSNYKPIVERDLFNAKAAAIKPQIVQSKDINQLEKTELNLKLWGTVTIAAGGAYAVIEETKGNRYGRRQMLYRKGDKIQGATIDRILDEKVVLSFNGEQQVLELEDKIGQPGGRTRYSAMRSSNTGGQPVHQKRRIRRAQIEDAMANLNEVMNQIRIYPHKDGIRVSHIKSRSIFRKMGLRNGDIITGINGQPLTSVEDAMGMYNQLQSSSNVSVQIKRRGRDRVIDYSIR